MTFFFDRCVAVTVARIIKALEHDKREVIYHDDRFDEKTPDTVWIADVATWNPKPIVVSGDTRILTRIDEARALTAANLTFFCLAHGWTNMNFRDYPWKFLKAWNNIDDALAKITKPSIFKVSCGSSLKVEQLSLTRDHQKG